VKKVGEIGGINYENYNGQNVARVTEKE